MTTASPFSPLASDTLVELVDRLAAAVHPRAVYLFGSHAHGVPRSDSDVDLMLLVDDPPDIELYQRGREAIRNMGLPIELHFCEKGRFERYATVFGTFQHDIRSKGILLYAA